VNNRIDIRMVFEYFVEGFLVGYVRLVEYRAFTTDELDTVKRLLRRVVEVVNNNNFVTSNQKL